MSRLQLERAAYCMKKRDSDFERFKNDDFAAAKPVASFPHLVKYQFERAYDRWFVKSVETGLKDAAEGRVLSPTDSAMRDEARCARLKN